MGRVQSGREEKTGVLWVGEGLGAGGGPGSTRRRAQSGPVGGVLQKRALGRTDAPQVPQDRVDLNLGGRLGSQGLWGPSPGPQKLSRRCCPPGVTQPSTSQHLQQTCSRVPGAPPCGGAPVPSPGLPTQRRSCHPHPAALGLSRDCMQDTDGPHWQGWGGGQETPRAGNAGGSKAACGEGPGGTTPTSARSQGALQKPKASPPPRG